MLSTVIFLAMGLIHVHIVRMNQRKRDHEKVIRRNITLPPALDARAKAFFRTAGFIGLSDYVQSRLRLDLGTDRNLLKDAA